MKIAVNSMKKIASNYAKCQLIYKKFKKINDLYQMAPLVKKNKNYHNSRLFRQ